MGDAGKPERFSVGGCEYGWQDCAYCQDDELGTSEILISCDRASRPDLGLCLGCAKDLARALKAALRMKVQE